MDSASTHLALSSYLTDPRSTEPISARELPYILEELGLLTLSEVVCPGVRIVETFGRNLCFKLMREDHSGIFVKQPLSFSKSSADSIGREAQVTGYLTDVQRDLLPALLGHDPRSGALVYELVNGSTLMEVRYNSPEDMPQAYGNLGVALADLHALQIDTELPNAVLPPLMQPGRWHDQNPDTATAMALLGREELLRSTSDKLLSDWQTNTLIHSDLKPNNILVPSNGHTTFIDWETGGLGDPRWDLGMSIGYLVSDAIYDHIREEEQGSLSETLSVARQGTASFLAGYSAASGNDFLAANSEGVACFAGMSIAQFVLALGRTARKPTHSMVQLTQLALNVIERPAEAMIVIFGYEET